MRNAISLLCLATFLSAFAAGCMPNSAVLATLSPRSYPYAPTVLPDPVAHR